MYLCGSDVAPENDNKLFEFITNRCVDTAKKLKMNMMYIDVSEKVLKPFPSLREVAFEDCTIDSDAILQLNKWCPNVIDLKFEEGIHMSEAVYDAFISSTQTLPNVKSLLIDFIDSSMELTQDLIAAINRQFPTLTNLQLKMPPKSCFSKDKLNVTYQPVNFPKLKKLSVQACGKYIDKLFDLLSISNDRLVEFNFTGVLVTDELCNWVKSCKKLKKLKIDCSFLSYHTVSSIKSMHLFI